MNQQSSKESTSRRHFLQCQKLAQVGAPAQNSHSIESCHLGTWAILWEIIVSGGEGVFGKYWVGRREGGGILEDLFLFF